MRRQLLFFPAALIVLLSGCGDTVRKPAPFVHLGLHADSASGAIMARSGDTVWNIAQRYRLSVRDIIDLNKLEPPYTLGEGKRLLLPPPVDYRVRIGDSLYSIATMFGVGVHRIVQVNNLREPYTLSVGQLLRIPTSLSHGDMPPVEKAPATVAVEQVELAPLAPPSATAGKVVLQPAFHPSSGFSWPVRGKIISGYGPKAGGLYNDGINIAAPKGAPVAAAAAGTVAYVGDDLKGYGNLVLIRHGGGMMTAYAHLGTIKVKKGMVVQKGQVIGSVGSTGSVTAPQLHFEIRHGSKTHDPKAYLG